jgi:eukaryotic-like serine/threonine-protein kinase
VTPPVTRIGRYTIESVIGTGAFATVYRAADERLGAIVAVKLLADNHCLDPDIRARFLDEGRALRRIDSPHVVRVYDVGETDRLQPYLVLEHADRGTLAQRVAARRGAGWRPTAADVRTLATQLAGAVAAVHAADLVHRDLTPGNVLVRSVAPGSPPSGALPPGASPSGGSPVGGALLAADERLVLTDLGLSKDLARNSGLTAAGGTDGFRPPEQRGGPARVDARADLWALSAVVLWLLTGRAPATDPPAPADVDRALVDLGLPAGLRAPLLRSLADDPDARHPDARAWLTEVVTALSPVVLPAAPSPAAPSPAALRLAALRPAHPSPLLPGPRRLVVAAALVVVGALAGGVGVWRAGSGDGDDPRVVERGDGQVEVVDQVGDARLRLTGPERATVGDVVTFEVAAEVVEHWAWVMPDGTVYADRASVQLGSSSPGVAPVVVVARAPGGERLEVTHEVRFVEG